MCRAGNIQGSVSSNDLYLDIKCESSQEQKRRRRGGVARTCESKLNAIDWEKSEQLNHTQHMKAFIEFYFFPL